MAFFVCFYTLPSNQCRDTFYKIRTSDENGKDDDKSDDVIFNHFSRLFFIFVLLRNRKEYAHHDTPYARGIEYCKWAIKSVCM